LHTWRRVDVDVRGDRGDRGGTNSRAILSRGLSQFVPHAIQFEKAVFDRCDTIKDALALGYNVHVYGSRV
jgi:hypothetical protein